MEKELQPNESIQLIERMIRAAQSNMEDNSFYYLLWGWLVFVAAIAHYILLSIQVSYNYIGWAVLMPLGGIITGIYARKEKKKAVTTYADHIMTYVLYAYLISLGLILLFMSKLQLGTYPMVMMVYGIWLFISGGALRFRPLIIGGILNWILAILAFFCLFESQLLILASAVMFGYIIPGHMLQSKMKKELNVNQSSSNV